jgi:Flp pilus assembly protein TadG
MRVRRRLPLRFQAGTTAVEFGIVSALFFTLLIGVMEMGRMLFYWNSAAEATRLGARMAVVCDIGDADIKARMRQMFSSLPADHIDIAYQPSGCTIDTCQTVTVSIAPGVSFTPMIPFLSLSVSMPSFSTTLPRESLTSEGGTSPVCT